MLRGRVQDPDLIHHVVRERRRAVGCRIADSVDDGDVEIVESGRAGGGVGVPGDRGRVAGIRDARVVRRIAQIEVEMISVLIRRRDSERDGRRLRGGIVIDRDGIALLRHAGLRRARHGITGREGVAGQIDGMIQHGRVIGRAGGGDGVVVSVGKRREAVGSDSADSVGHLHD